MADVDDQNEQLRSSEDVDDSIGSNPMGVPARESSFQGFARVRIVCQVVQRPCHAPVEQWFSPGHPTDDTLRLPGQLDPIRGQSMP